MYNIHHLREARRMRKRRQAFAQTGFNRFRGDAKEICKQVVEACFNGHYFQTSLGHFDVFYMRDFGICVEALLELGYKEEVYKTLQYALVIYSRNNKITTTISKDGEPFDVFTYAPDSLAFLIHSLRLAKAQDLVETYRPFLEREIEKFMHKAIDKKSGLIKTKRFSSMKDNSHRKSSCYDNCMAAMLKEDLSALQLINPLQDYNYEQLLKLNYWSKSFFEDDFQSRGYVAGDANVFPFWCNVIQDKELLSKSMASIRHTKLDTPYPLQYTEKKIRHHIHKLLEMFAPGYEDTTIWLHLGLCYLDIIRTYDSVLFRKYMALYANLIETHKTMPEVLNADGSIYKRLFYVCDEGMLWAAKYLALTKHL